MSHDEAELLHPDEARRIVLSAAPAPRFEEIEPALALGRALAGPLASPVDHPPFDKSAMDGFAFPGGTSAGPWRVVGTMAAGGTWPTGADGRPRALLDGECARIMTGAPLPSGARVVQRVEYTEPAGQAADGVELVRWTRAESGSNVIARGENLRAGAELLGPRLLSAQDLGILASGGITQVRVARRPLVGVLSTGDELAPSGETLGESAIYDSNGPQLLAQARAAGAEARSYGIARDDPAVLAERLGKALDECDVVLVSGGVSMGDFDHVPRTLESLGVRRLFHKVAVRPGKPTWFGVRGDKAVFGLPGNPVSTFVNFEFLVRAHLMARMGLSPEPRILKARMGWNYSRREADRVEFLPARLSTDRERQYETVFPAGYKGSSMLSVLSGADCLVRVELGVLSLGEGALVDARLVRP